VGLGKKRCNGKTGLLGANKNEKGGQSTGSQRRRGERLSELRTKGGGQRYGSGGNDFQKKRNQNEETATSFQSANVKG